MNYAVLIIEDEVTLAKKLSKYLSMDNFDVRVVDNGQDGLNALTEFFPDVVILDFNLPGHLNGLEVLKQIKAFDPTIKIIMMTGHGNTQLAVDAMKAGAYDYLSKPVILSELKLLLKKAIGQNQTDGQLSYFHDKDAARSGIEQIIGQSAVVRQMKNDIVRITQATRELQSDSPPSILVLGETGTGKELIARALHFSGGRADKPFIELNLAAIPSHLLESELFGYEKGAFTDARKRKLGLVEAADGGTLFLDEIGELSLNAQVKLLKLLEDRRVRRLGSIRDYSVDIQVITATNRPLEQMVREGLFRQDLYYRLNTLTIEAPPLRSREDDSLLLAQYFIALYGKKYNKPELQLSQDVAQAIHRYHWPGNIRELSNVMEQAVLHCNGREILSLRLMMPLESQLQKTTEPFSVPADDKLADAEQQLIEQILKEVNGNISKAARKLGITRDRLRYRIKKYQL